MSNRICLICNNDKSYTTKNKYEQWYKHKDGFICNKCKKMLIRKKIIWI